VPKQCKGSQKDSPALKKLKPTLPSFVLSVLFIPKRATKGPAAGVVIYPGYYLPYRLHASVQQFHRAYPQAARFFELKRLHDPEETFQNLFYRTYATH
jgi:hypothetical protein